MKIFGCYLKLRSRCIILLLIFLGSSVQNFGRVPFAEKPQLLVLTDIGGDPDDIQSLRRLIVYSNEFEIKGLIAPATWGDKDMRKPGVFIEPSVEFKLFGNTFGLDNRHNLKGKLLKDSWVSKVVGFGKNASGNGYISKSKVKRSFGMSNSDICEFSKTMTAYELTIHNDQHMTPVGWCHSECTVFVIDNQSFEVSFREKLHNLCENKFADLHTCLNLHLSAKEQNSKERQYFEGLVCC